MEQSLSWESLRFSFSKKTHVFYKTRRFITTLTSARHLSLSWTRSIQYVPPHPTSWRSILILSYLSPGLPSGLFPSGFPTRILYAPLLFPIRATSPNHLILDFITRLIKLLLYSFFHCPVTSSLFYLSPYSQTPSATFLPQYKRAGFTPAQNKRQNNSSLYFWITNWKTKILHLMTGIIIRCRIFRRSYTPILIFCYANKLLFLFFGYVHMNRE
jgi:hypothetical protein